MVVACSKKSECEGFDNQAYIESGFVDAESNYGIFATSSNYTDYDQGDPAAGSIIIRMSNYQNCSEKSGISCRIDYTLNDTVYLEADDNRLFFVDSDIYYGYYEMNPDFNNWMLVTGITNNTTLNAEFEFSFVVPEDDSAFPRDDPNRPDTLYFTNGILASNYFW